MPRLKQQRDSGATMTGIPAPPTGVPDPDLATFLDRDSGELRSAYRPVVQELVAEGCLTATTSPTRPAGAPIRP
jgi:hypothetical protein